MTAEAGTGVMLPQARGRGGPPGAGGDEGGPCRRGPAESLGLWPFPFRRAAPERRQTAFPSFSVPGLWCFVTGPGEVMQPAVLVPENRFDMTINAGDYSS